MAAQDFDLYTEVDPGSDISVVDTQVVVSGLDRDVSSFLYYDFGADYWTNGYQCRMRIQVPSGTDATGEMFIGCFTSDTGDLATLEANSGDYLALRVYNDAGTLYVVAAECVNGSVTEGTARDISGYEDQNLWLHIEKDHNQGTYGSYRCYIFDELDTSQEDYEIYINVTGVALSADFDLRYFMPVSSSNDGTTGKTMDIEINDCYVGGTHSDVTYNQTTVYGGASGINIEYLKNTTTQFCKTASGRWYGHLRYTLSNNKSMWSYSDDDGATWNGPYLFGAGGWIAYGNCCTPLATWDFDDALIVLDYKDNVTFSLAGVQGPGSTGAFGPGTLGSVNSVTGWTQFINLVNLQTNDETYIIWASYTGSGGSVQYGFTIDYTDHNGASGWTEGTQENCASSIGNSLNSVGGLKAIASRDSSSIYILARSYTGSVNNDGLRIYRYTTATHTLGAHQTLLTDWQEISFTYIQATVDLNDRIHVVFGNGQTADGYQRTYHMIVEDDGDDTFTVYKSPSLVMMANDRDLLPGGVAINALGEIFVLCSDDSTTEDYIFMRKSTDGGETWSTIYEVYTSGNNIYGQGPYQLGDRPHTYLDSGEPPFVYVNEITDDYYFMKSSTQGDYLTAWPDAVAEDLDNWGRKVKITINKDEIAEDLTHFPVILNHQTLPSEMFEASGEYPAQENGYDIRASLDADGEQRLPVDVREFHISTNTGEVYANICIGFTGDALTTGEDTEFYVWYNNPDATLTTVGEAFGTRAVYDDNFVGVWPFVRSINNIWGEIDRTGRGRSWTQSNMDSTNRVTGEISHGQEFDGVDQEMDLHSYDTYANGWLIEDWPFTVSFIARADVGGSYLQTRDDNWSHWFGVYAAAVGSGLGVRLNVDDGTTDVAATTTEFETGEARFWATGVGVSSSAFYAQLNDNTRAANADSQNFPTPDPQDEFTKICNILRLGGDSFWTGYMEEMRVSDVARSEGWTKTEYRNIFDPGNFFTASSPENAGPAAAILRRHMCNLMLD